MPVRTVGKDPNLLKETAPDAVLTCMYRTLQLGFVGQYRAQDDERREDIVRALAERVPAFTLAQDAPSWPAHHACAAAVAGTG
jgi:type VI secretion system protein ImpK